MNILIVHPKDNNSEIISFSYESQLKCQVKWVSTYAEALDLFLEDQDVDLIICRNQTGDLKILLYLLSVGLKIPYVLIGESEDQTDNVKAFPELKCLGKIPAVSHIDELSLLVREGLKGGDLSLSSENPDFCRIPTELLLRVKPLASDIYIRLSKIKYVKMFRKGRTFKEEDAQRFLEQKKIRYLYIKNDEVGETVHQFKRSILEMVQSGEITGDRKAIVASSILESVASFTQQIGFSSVVQEIAKQGVNLTIESVGQTPQMKKMFDMIGNNLGTYFSFHSIAVAHVSCSIAAKMQWPSEGTFRKLSLASFFHDLSLHPPRLAEFENSEEIERHKDSLTEKDIKLIKNHPMAASEALKKFTEIPPDVDTIVAQHHERPDGKGFPRGLTATHIAPLASLFIVSHDLVKFLYENPKEVNCQAFKERFGYTEEFNRGTFPKIFEAIEFPSDN